MATASRLRCAFGGNLKNAFAEASSSRRAQRQTVGNRTLVTRPVRHAVPVSSTTAAHAEADAKLLRELFDAPGSSRVPGTSSDQVKFGSSGLFQSESLRSTQAFEAVAQRTLLRCQLIVSRIIAAPQNGPQEMSRVVRNLDRLSDLLCGIIDCAELIRNAHPDRRWVECANNIYEGLCGFMNELNTHTGLYHVLAQVLDDKDLRAKLSPEALAVAYVFLRDFEKSGIHLPEAQRAQFVKLSDEILVLGRSFLQNGAESQADVIDEMPLEWLEGTPSTIVEALRGSQTQSKGKMRLRRNSWGMQVIAKYVPDERARRLAYVGMNTGSGEQVTVLESLLERRAELAQLTGSESFASMTLNDKMARKPENVDGFLASLARHHRPLAERDLNHLRDLKQAHQGTRDFFAWDRDYYAEKYLRNLTLKSTAPPIGNFFSVGTVFAGLSRLFERLYGITLRAAPAQKGETWADDVSKMEVLEDGHKIGTIYADLYNRPGKPPSAAHYTVRCSRRTDDDDDVNDFSYGRLASGQQLAPTEGAQQTTTLDTNPVRLPDRQGLYQMPIVVLLFDFVRPTTSSQPSLLSWQEVETLFHEMGHAIHSMIGRTEYHNVSGTRCATDFVELPSILMEHFVSSPQVVELVARHHATGASLPYSHLQAHLAVQRSLDSLDTHNQIMLATLDQMYHAQPASNNGVDTTALLQDLQSRLGIIPPVEGTAWQVNFSHLFGYGATYYSYLFDRAIASRIWQRLFSKDPLDRAAGEAFKTRVLAHGGGRDPWSMLAEVLQDDELAEGADSARAMQAVGRWGIADAVGAKP